MKRRRQDLVTLKEYTDQGFAYLLKLGIGATTAVIAGGWITFALMGKALTVALDASNRELEAHNGTIRKWEIERGEREAKLATKAEIEPLIVDYREKRGGAITAGRFWAAVVIVGTLMLATGAFLAPLLRAGQ
jgi:hypothetical protein